MPQHNRNDTPIHAKCPACLPLIEQAAARLSTRGLPKPPPGIAPRKGAYYAATRTTRQDGTVRVYVKWYQPGWQTTVLGSYILTPQERVPVGRVIHLACGRSVRVAVDAAGLPVPVPVELSGR